MEQILEVNWVHVLNALNWGLQLPLLAWLLVVMVRRGVHREFPWYFAYLAWVLGSSLAMAPLYLWEHDQRTHSWLFWSHWATEAVSVGLGFLVIYELLRKVFEPYESFRRWAPALFRWGGAGLLLAAALLAYLNPGTLTLHLALALLNLERTLRFVQAGLLLLVLVCVVWLKTWWRSPVVGIALGFGLYAAFAVVSATVLLHSGWWGASLLNLLDPTAYSLTTLIWAAYLLPKPALAPSPRLPQMDVKQWNQALSQLLGR